MGPEMPVPFAFEICFLLFTQFAADFADALI